MNAFRAVFQQRFRGFRLIDLGAFACLTALVLGVYAFKAHAGGESAKIAEVDSQIADEEHRIRLLDADLAGLEQPSRLEQLSTQYLGLAPIPANHETTPGALMEIARAGATPAVPPKPGSGAKTAVPANAAIAAVLAALPGQTQ